MSSSSTARSAVYIGLPLPPGTSGSWMPPSSLYWIQKSASSISSAAGNRSSAASPVVKPPRLASAIRLPPNTPTPTVPAPTASELRRNERRLIKLFRALTLFSKLCSRGRFALLLESFAVGSVILFMPVESERFALRAASEKLHGCYLPDLGIGRVFDSSYRAVASAGCAVSRKESGAYGIRTRDLLNAIEALYQLS